MGSEVKSDDLIALGVLFLHFLFLQVLFGDPDDDLIALRDVLLVQILPYVGNPDDALIALGGVLFGNLEDGDPDDLIPPGGVLFLHFLFLQVHFGNPDGGPRGWCQDEDEVEPDDLPALGGVVFLEVLFLCL